jgi:hypothetical protein
MPESTSKESQMNNRAASKGSKNDDSLLFNLARTIGSTLGTVAAKADDMLSKPTRRRRASRKPRSRANKTRKKVSA